MDGARSAEASLPAPSSWPSRRDGVARRTPSGPAPPSRCWPAISPRVLADRLLLDLGVRRRPPRGRARPLSPDADRHGARARPRHHRRATRSRHGGGAQGWLLHGGGTAADRRGAGRRRQVVLAALAAYGAPARPGVPAPATTNATATSRSSRGGSPQLVAQARAALDALGLDPRRGRIARRAGRPGGGRMTGDIEFLRRAFRDVPTCHSGDARPVRVRLTSRLAGSCGSRTGSSSATRRGDAAGRTSHRDPRVSVVIDRGRDWAELTGVRHRRGGRGHRGRASRDPRRDVGVAREVPLDVRGRRVRAAHAAQVASLGFLSVTIANADAWDHRTR